MSEKESSAKSNKLEAAARESVKEKDSKHSSRTNDKSTCGRGVCCALWKPDKD